jgi:hypothetical protein
MALALTRRVFASFRSAGAVSRPDGWHRSPPMGVRIEASGGEICEVPGGG